MGPFLWLPQAAYSNPFFALAGAEVSFPFPTAMSFLLCINIPPLEIREGNLKTLALNTGITLPERDIWATEDPLKERK